MSLQILIVDDHGVVRKGMRALLTGEKDWAICAEASNGNEALEKAAELQPDVAILDISMPEMNGIEATRRIRTLSPNTQILILSMHDSELLLSESIKAGAHGYVLKEDADTCLLPALNALRKRKVYYSPGVKPRSARQPNGNAVDAAALAAFRPLTSREREIIQLIAKGRRNKEIADSLQIAVKTVEAHRYRLMHKLGLHSVAELVHYAIHNKLTA
jgi:DNA-binding NarL/FixJ family response regulator